MTKDLKIVQPPSSGMLALPLQASFPGSSPQMACSHVPWHDFCLLGPPDPFHFYLLFGNMALIRCHLSVRTSLVKPRSEEVLSPVTAFILRCIHTAHTSLCVSHTLVYMAHTWPITPRNSCVHLPWVSLGSAPGPVLSDQPDSLLFSSQPFNKVALAKYQIWGYDNKSHPCITDEIKEVR